MLCLFEKYKIYKKDELLCRAEVQYEEYYKIRLIEAKTLLHITYSELIPTLNKEMKEYGSSPIKETLFGQDTLKLLSSTISNMYTLSNDIETQINQLCSLKSVKEKGLYLLKNIVPLLDELRKTFDSVESVLTKDCIDYPTYKELFFRLDY